MPPLRDRHHEEVKRAMVDALKLIDSGADPNRYHMKTEAAFPTHVYKKQYWQQTEYDLWHALRSGITPVTFVMGCGYEWRAEFYVLACLKSSEEGRVLEAHAEPDDVQYTTLQNRMLDDIESAIMEGPDRIAHPLNGTSSDGEALCTEVDITDVNRLFLEPGWCCLEVRVETVYYTPKRAA